MKGDRYSPVYISGNIGLRNKTANHEQLAMSLPLPQPLAKVLFTNFWHNLC